jgi:hypothetical protein
MYTRTPERIYQRFQFGLAWRRSLPKAAHRLTPTWAPLGATWYNSLQAKATKRFSDGLDFTYAFTCQKSQNLGAERPFGNGPEVRKRLRRQLHAA